MDKKFVRVLANLSCEWEGLNPIYRVYVDDELFAERTWAWPNSYIEELLQIQAPAGDYQLHWELVPPHLARLTVHSVWVEHGSATVENNVLRITE